MAKPTQKQIAEKYKGNLGYFHKPHYYRSLRLIAFLVVALASIAAVFTWRFWGNEEMFSTGPISANHAKFAHDCRACHVGADPDFLKGLSLPKPRELSLQTVADAAQGLTSLETIKITAEKMRAHTDKAHLAALVQRGLEVSSLSNMDRACLRCHEALDLHQPQAAALRLRPVTNQFALVHAGGCSTCHREHVSHEPMKLPASESCEACHNDREVLTRTRALIGTKSDRVPKVGENRDIGDGLIRFISPPVREAQPVAFRSYADGHPPFDYEQPNLRDPAIIKFNHFRHTQADVKTGDGKSLQCADCHTPGANGVYMQRINYDAHCRKCHSLNLVPEYPEMTVPHGRAEHVMHFLDPSTLTVKYREAIVARGINDPELIRQQVTQDFEKLASRMRGTDPPLIVLQKRVFLTGDPPIEPGNERITPRSNKGQFLSGCAKCHTVEFPGRGGIPVVAETNMAERWVHRGPFTHLPHQHMSCTDCHGAANESKLTTDILMPPQKLCAECHRPLAAGVRERDGFAVQHAELRPNTPELAAAQRRDGGVRADCQVCHAFHAPPSSLEVLRAGNR